MRNQNVPDRVLALPIRTLFVDVRLFALPSPKSKGDEAPEPSENHYPDYPVGEQASLSSWGHHRSDGVDA